MLGTVTCDISEYQPVVSNSYPHQWLIFRACDGNYVDRNAAKNLAWAKAAVKSGRIAGYTVYCVYRPNSPTLATVKQIIGTPDAHVTVMVDVESWGGAIRGDHSPQITALADGLAAWLGDRRRVLAYGNQYDLGALYRNRPAWLRFVVAAYGPTQPRVANMLGWQYTDGQAQRVLAAGLPRSSKPFGACDHNLFPGLTPAELAETLGVGEDMPLTDAEISKIADAVWSKKIADPDNPKVAPTSASWLVYGNKKGGQALAAAQAALAAVRSQQIVVDAAAVAADIKQRVITLLGGQP